MNYSSRMLPILGVVWHQFPTQREAQRFADWAEWYTRRHEHPCKAFVAHRTELPEGSQWEVKVKNW
jgi:hypothetical protein